MPRVYTYTVAEQRAIDIRAHEIEQHLGIECSVARECTEVGRLYSGERWDEDYQGRRWAR